MPEVLCSLSARSVGAGVECNGCAHLLCWSCPAWMFVLAAALGSCTACSLAEGVSKDGALESRAPTFASVLRVCQTELCTHCQCSLTDLGSGECCSWPSLLAAWKGFGSGNDLGRCIACLFAQCRCTLSELSLPLFFVTATAKLCESSG